MRLKLSSDKEKETRTKPTKARPKRIRRPRTRRSITFLVALAISSLLWLVTALNNPSNRMVELAIPVKYENLTESTLLKKSLPMRFMYSLKQVVSTSFVTLFFLMATPSSTLLQRMIYTIVALRYRSRL